MSTKVKGLLKGLHYISQIFDEEKEKEMQIGFPTDVKHVAHIGWDGPSTDNPSWMKEFNGPGQFQSAPLVPPGDHKENPEIKWVSEDSNRRSRNANSASAGDQSEQPPKSSRRHSSKENGGTDCPKRESSKSRRHRRKDSTDGSKHGRQVNLDSAAGSESPARDIPDIPKKSRRKKSKESVPGGSAAGSRSSKSKGTSSSSTAPPSDHGSRPDKGSEASIQDTRNSEGIIS
ncbi:PREDICTED: CRIB domain-containing protein RIC6-like [Nicotiana attenuata]|uniref:Crib domain-containing protein ric3 n=1 Tax=Nicotiana attenuata TaxID=49451 RepID=A0A1J6IQV7_NICAT|nr:PREDICTED: CRIB domain-containing protein RIC6-like [Nicotiana attenuata]OIT02936.1 crib domain-containing protein ric3 [Nicotiana attenuata]